MATVDLSRSGTEFGKHYRSVRAQMGRVLTDDDHNENERLHGEDERRALVDIVGPAGSPDAGFSIHNPTVDPVSGSIDFEIAPGSFYLGGNRLVLEQTEQFRTQRDWLNMPPGAAPTAHVGAPRFDLVFLECWHQPAAAVEDSEMFEVGLAGPDTSQRMRLMRRVHVAPGVTIGDCHQDWTTLIGTWSKAGLGTLNEQDELVVNTKLKVGFLPGTNPADLCSPPVAGGYLGAENQAIRVQLVDQSSFTWGLDNAAPLYRVNIGPNNAGQPRKITLMTEPKDQAHWPVAGQIVEILPWSAVLGNMEKLAEQRGFLARVGTSYDPDSKELFLAASVPAGFGEDWKTRPDAAKLGPEFFYMRVWNRGTDTTSPPSISFTTGVAVPLGNTGLTITFSGTDHHPDDFWIIAARPESPNRVVPWLLESGRAPHGVHRFYTVLGIIQWTPGTGGKVTHDCREHFPPLTRLQSCCTYTVGDETSSFGAYKTIQSAIDALPDEGGDVCLLPGVYKENVTILNRHGIGLHGCGRRSIVLDSGGAKAAVITIQDSQRINVSNLAIQAPQVIGIQVTSTPAAEANRHGIESISLEDLTIEARDVSAIDCRGGKQIRICRNDIAAQPLAATLENFAAIGQSPLVFVGADDVLVELNRISAAAPRRIVLQLGGLQIDGGSDRVEIRRNRIVGGNGNGITLGSYRWVSANPDPAGGLAVSFTIIGSISLVFDDKGCLQPNPKPRPPKDPQGVPMLPVSDGDLYDIRILDNDILDMGTCGISTLRFFPPLFGPIGVHGLEVARNRIRHCMQLELGTSFGTDASAGFGGVFLASVEDFELRDNTIESNGQSFIDPICGVCVAVARGFVAEGNVISENGPRVETNKSPTNGPRGGIIVGLAMTPFLAGGVQTKIGYEQTGFPAARIVDNIVTAPHGRALFLGARGSVMIEGNTLTCRGVEIEGQQFGAAVWIVNTGVAYELGPFLGFSKMAFVQPSAVAGLYQPFGVGGEVLFNDNQVLLAPATLEGPTINSSVLIQTADDVSFDGNQSECRLSQRNLLMNGAVVAWSTRTTGNRFEEPMLPGLSALTLAVMNTTANNQGTRCFAALGLALLLVKDPNRSLVSLLASDACVPLQQRLFAAMRQTGFDA